MHTDEDIEPDPDDCFRPPAIPTMVGCIHCGEEYDSYLIEWRVQKTSDGKMMGFWCCPTPGCDGAGFGFDILPVDPDYQDERGGWVRDDGEDDEDFDEIAFDDDWEIQGDGPTTNGRDDNEALPF